MTTIPACQANRCDQGRRDCPCPDACHLPEDECSPSMLAGGWFWFGGAVSVAVWAALIWIFEGLA